MEGKLMLQIMILACFWWSSITRTNSHDEFQSFLTTNVDDHKYHAYPRSPIRGRRGYCIDVKDSDYHNGNPTILWPCTPGQLNQMWTFKSDGTLRSNGRCLTTNTFHQGSYITIFDCKTAVKEATFWELKSDGEIVNPKSGLVVTTMSARARARLTAETSISSSFQTWRVDNNTKPRLVSIIGFNDLCLQATGDSVWVEECDSSNVRQQWLLFPDGTIRRKGDTKLCVGYNNLVDKGVVVITCGLGSSSQRWLFTENGTIWNERVDLVMDVKKSDPSYKEILVWEATGNPNQKWKISPLSLSSA